MKFAVMMLAGLLALGGQNAQAQTPAPTAMPGDNTELRELFDKDQADRAGTQVDWPAVNERDAQRRARVAELLQSGLVRTANDYRHAAFVFQHGGDSDSYRLAHALAVLAMTLEDSRQNRWIAAAAWDRLLMSRLQPQWYGTQFRSDAQGLFLYPVADDAVDEDERTRMVGRSLEETRAKLPELAMQFGQRLRPNAPTLEELRAEARAAKPESGGP